MLQRSLSISFAALALLGACQVSERATNTAPARGGQALPSVESFARRLDASRQGFLDVLVDEQEGKLYLVVPRDAFELIYAPWIATGLGSNPVGLDRGKLAEEQLVRFDRVGRRVYLRRANLRFRARSESGAERRAVAESFAESTIWAGDVVAESGARFAVDATSLVLRDAAGIARGLRSAGQGSYKLDLGRSSLWLGRTKAFPRNSEVEVALTFTSDAPGAEVRRTAPDARAVTLRVHHSFVALPEPGYEPRVFHPRSGCFALSFVDYATPLGEDMNVRWVTRHRLQKATPGAAPSKAVEPIVYWLDPGAPEPVRSALLDGARWWAEAFEAAGFVDAFQVRVLPEDVDPLDVRYNVIQWTHRSTRGWSYGRSVKDPRTGEILKGHVTLGSLRVRQDRRIFAGLASSAGCAASGGPCAHALASLAAQDVRTETSLARLRQLSAHEVGHTLGFAHNFAASTRQRASVMDYPAPLVKLAGGRLDFSDAYDVGIGAWDVLSVRYAYTEFEDAAREGEGLRAILDEARARDLPFVTDQDARAVSAAHPEASLWDNGADAVAELERLGALRAFALGQFTPARLRAGASQSELEELLVPLYLMQRYQIEAAAKWIGGLEFDYADAAEDRDVRPVDRARQLRAIAALLACVEPAALRVPDACLDKLLPRAFGSSPFAERFPRAGGSGFDEAAAARVLADLVMRALLDGQRCARLALQHARDEQLPGLSLALRAVMQRLGSTEAGDGRAQQLRLVAMRSFADRVFALASDASLAPVVRERAADFVVTELARWEVPATAPFAAFLRVLNSRVRAFAERAHEQRQGGRAFEAPPGSPIGQRSK